MLREIGTFLLESSQRWTGCHRILRLILKASLLKSELSVTRCAHTAGSLGSSAHNCPTVVRTLTSDSEIVLREDSPRTNENPLNLALVVLTTRDCKAVQFRDL